MVFQLSKVEEQVAECLVFTSYSSYIIMDHFPRDVTCTRKFDITPRIIQEGAAHTSNVLCSRGENPTSTCIPVM